MSFMLWTGVGSSGLQEKHRLYETVRNELQAGKQPGADVWVGFIRLGDEVEGLGLKILAGMYKSVQKGL